MKQIIIFLCLMSLIGCTTKTENTEDLLESISIVDWDSDDLDDDYSDEDVQNITLKHNEIMYDGNDATVSGTTITITKAGSYAFRGTLDDGAIIVDTTSDSLVRIILNDADITSSTSAPIYIKQADKVLLTLAENSNNTLRDGTSYKLADASVNEPNAAIFSKDDLTINGSGSLIVEANYNNGIQSKDDLKIVSGNINVTAQDDGLVGKDLVALKQADITLNTQSDGIKTTNTEDSEKGNLVIENGNINIISQTDGLQSSNTLYIYQGNITIQSGGGSVNNSKQSTMMNGNPWGNWNTADEDDTTSAKGMKAQNTIEISNGTFDLDTADDTLHSNGTLTIQDGSFNISSGDDGMHADTTLTIFGGYIQIKESYEGIESSELYFNGGTIHIKASDDGVNAAGGNDGSSTDGRPGQNNFTADASKQIIIDGSYLYIDASGDGIDSNGTITMNSGTVIVNGPIDGANGALDFDGNFTITGGYLLTTGSSAMLQMPTQIENGNLLTIGLSSNDVSLIHIEDSENHNILTFQPTKNIQSLVLYTSELQTGNTYNIYLNGTVSGDCNDGIYENPSYENGTLYESFTISSASTTVGNLQGGMQNGMMNGGNPGMENRANKGSNSNMEIPQNYPHP